MWAKIKRWFYKLIGRKSKEDEVFGLEVFDGSGDKILSINSNTCILAAVVKLRVRGATTVSRDYSNLGSRLVILGISGGVYSYSETTRGASITITSDHPQLDATFTLGIML